ncbi:hypothetical protein FOZ60_001652, partial [Perkinsus olseni]
LTKVEKVDTRWVDQKTPTSSTFKKNWSDDGNYGWSSGKKSWYETEDSSWYSDKGSGWYDQGWSSGKKNKSWSSHQNKQWSEEPAKSEVPKKVGNGSIEVESSKKVNDKPEDDAIKFLRTATQHLDRLRLRCKELELEIVGLQDQLKSFTSRFD